MSTDIKEGGRDLRFGNESTSWKMLDCWREEAGDISDEEDDDFELDGSEDDDLGDNDD